MTDLHALYEYNAGVIRSRAAYYADPFALTKILDLEDDLRAVSLLYRLHWISKSTAGRLRNALRSGHHGRVQAARERIDAAIDEMNAAATDGAA